MVNAKSNFQFQISPESGNLAADEKRRKEIRNSNETFLNFPSANGGHELKSVNFVPNLGIKPFWWIRDQIHVEVF
jgi:hypothetical protein